jgi:hypothetical protein
MRWFEVACGIAEIPWSESRIKKPRPQVLDWGFSVGGRIGWLATQNTLLYFLAGYTYAELDKARLNVSTNAVFSTTQAGITSLGGGCPVFGGCPLGLTANLPDSLDGYTLGGGSEVKIGGGPWSIKASLYASRGGKREPR